MTIFDRHHASWAVALRAARQLARSTKKKLHQLWRLIGDQASRIEPIVDADADDVVSYIATFGEGAESKRQRTAG